MKEGQEEALDLVLAQSTDRRHGAAAHGGATSLKLQHKVHKTHRCLTQRIHSYATERLGRGLKKADMTYFFSLYMPGDFETNKNLSEGHGTLREMPAKSFMWFGWHSWFTRLYLQNRYRRELAPKKKEKKKRFWGAQPDGGESFPLVEHWHVLVQTACKPETL